MVFNCVVKHNGIAYPVGADVPIGVETRKVEESAGVKSSAPSDTYEANNYTKAEIWKMNAETMYALADALNIHDVKGIQCKKAICEKLGL